jgi:hypothetical protein
LFGSSFSIGFLKLVSFQFFLSVFAFFFSLDFEFYVIIFPLLFFRLCFTFYIYFLCTFFCYIKIVHGCRKIMFWKNVRVGHKLMWLCVITVHQSQIADKNGNIRIWSTLRPPAFFIYSQIIINSKQHWQKLHILWISLICRWWEPDVYSKPMHDTRTKGGTRTTYRLLFWKIMILGRGFVSCLTGYYISTSRLHCYAANRTVCTFSYII